MPSGSSGVGHQGPPAAALFALLTGAIQTKCVYVAAKLGLPDLLASGPRRSDDLAALVPAHRDALRRLLRLLAHLGILAEDPDGRFGLTPLGALLRTDAPGSLRPFALLAGEPEYRALEGLLHSVQTGGTAFEHVWGQSYYDWLKAHPDAGRHFQQFLAGVTSAITAAVLEAYDFSSYRRIVDVGGGHGRMLAGILNAHPQATGVLFDLAPVVDEAGAHLEAAGVAARCTVVAGDFFEGVPRGGDCYLLSQVLHNWDEDRGRRILEHCRRAMAPDGKLLVIEYLLPERVTQPDPAIVYDLGMLAFFGGRERTEADYRAFLADAGFGVTTVVPTRSRRCIIEAVPAADEAPTARRNPRA